FRQLGRHLGNLVRLRHLTMLPVVPAAIDRGGEEEGDEEDDAAGEAALLQRLGEDEGLAPAQPAGLVLELTDDLLAIEPQELGIGAYEADGISRPGEVLEAAVLDGLEVASLDAQGACHVDE